MAAHAAVLGLAPLLAPGNAAPALLGPLDAWKPLIPESPHGHQK